MNSILIVEDDELLADNISVYLTRNQWQTHVAHSTEDALTKLESVHPDMILTDHKLPGKSGLELISGAHAIAPHIKSIMMTGEGGIEVAVGAMKAGAFDYLTKPISLAHLKVVLNNALAQAQRDKPLSELARRPSPDLVVGKSQAAIIGESPAMLATKARLQHVLEAEKAINDHDLPAILITGETGTGKELLARAVHFDGVRRRGPFVEINCASLPPNLLEAELFGHERGSFTDAKERRIGLVEAADGGTLFLDEIGEVDLSIQAKLLKVLEEKSVRRLGSVREQSVNIRIISATNRDLEKLVREGRFRSDLYFRLRVVTLSMPPLRNGGDDILRLANFYLESHGRRYGKAQLRFTAEAEQLMLNYSWPGNVREMRNMLEQTVLLAPDDWITPDQLAICPGLLRDDRRQEEMVDDEAAEVAWGGTKIADLEREMVSKALAKTDWNLSKSARLLGLSRDILRNRVAKYGILRPAD
ncbi:MAG: Fis family two component sigma-54 specific transcriptional regulator [Proteobacteria bacterium]|nr:Fis family two component sigma-54 specific transcriptional regulator [Pseudomonadota bacterium]